MEEHQRYKSLVFNSIKRKASRHYGEKTDSLRAGAESCARVPCRKIRIMTRKRGKYSVRHISDQGCSLKEGRHKGKTKRNGMPRRENQRA